MWFGPTACRLHCMPLHPLRWRWTQSAPPACRLHAGALHLHACTHRTPHLTAPPFAGGGHGGPHLQAACMPPHPLGRRWTQRDPYLARTSNSESYLVKTRSEACLPVLDQQPVTPFQMPPSLYGAKKQRSLLWKSSLWKSSLWSL